MLVSCTFTAISSAVLHSCDKLCIPLRVYFLTFFIVLGYCSVKKALHKIVVHTLYWQNIINIITATIKKISLAFAITLFLHPNQLWLTILFPETSLDIWNITFPWVLATFFSLGKTSKLFSKALKVPSSLFLVLVHVDVYVKFLL